MPMPIIPGLSMFMETSGDMGGLEYIPRLDPAKLDGSEDGVENWVWSGDGVENWVCSWGGLEKGAGVLLSFWSISWSCN